MMALMAELDRSIDKHGDWSGYDDGDICKAVCDEHQEYLTAYIANDITSQHGQAAELLQTAAVCIKGFFTLGGLNLERSNIYMQMLREDPQSPRVKAVTEAERCCYCLQPVRAREEFVSDLSVAGLGG